MPNEHESKQKSNSNVDEENWGRYDDDEWQAPSTQEDGKGKTLPKKAHWASDQFAWQVWKCF